LIRTERELLGTIEMREATAAQLLILKRYPELKEKLRAMAG